MFCPNCGSKNNKNQKFCRFCGFNLEEAARSLKNQLAFGERAYSLKSYDKFRGWISRVSEGLWLVFLIGLIFFLFFERENLRTFMKLSLSVGVIFEAIRYFAGYLQRRKVAETEFEKMPLTQKEIENAETNKLLEESRIEPVVSAAENSTRLLFAENKTRKFE